MGKIPVTWAKRSAFALPTGWDPVPFRLKSGALISCPFDGNQPYIVQPRNVDIDENIEWAKAFKINSAGAFGLNPFRYAEFASKFDQNAKFDYQRPPNTNYFLAFYISFASYPFGVLGYYAGFSMDVLFEGGGRLNQLHALEDRVTHLGQTTIKTSGADGLTPLNEWCIRRAFQDIKLDQIP